MHFCLSFISFFRAQHVAQLRTTTPYSGALKMTCRLSPLWLGRRYMTDSPDTWSDTSIGKTPISRQHLRVYALGLDLPQQVILISRVREEHIRNGGVIRLVSTVPFVERVAAYLTLDKWNRTQVVVELKLKVRYALLSDEIIKEVCLIIEHMQ